MSSIWGEGGNDALSGAIRVKPCAVPGYCSVSGNRGYPFDFRVQATNVYKQRSISLSDSYIARMACPNPAPVVKETPPLMKKLFGEHWEDLDAHPDCWNRLFGPDSDHEDEAEELEEEEKAKESKTSKNLIDHNWIKQRLDEEVCRFVLEDLHWAENRKLTLQRTKVLLVACLIAVAAQFPYLVPMTTPAMHMVSNLLIGAFFLSFIYAQVIGCGISWNTILDVVDSSEDAKDGFYVETELPRYEMEYKVSFRLKRDQAKTESCIVPATILFTPSARLTPEPLHDSLRTTLKKLLKSREK